jgi:hypothetical protein
MLHRTGGLRHETVTSSDAFDLEDVNVHRCGQLPGDGRLGKSRAQAEQPQARRRETLRGETVEVDRARADENVPQEVIVNDHRSR